MLNPSRTVDELKELRALTGDARRGPAGGVHAALGRRPGVAAGRSWPACRSRSTRTPAATCGRRSSGASDRELVIGGHLDSVPNGGWLDGCLNVLAGLEVLRRIAAEGTPPVTVRAGRLVRRGRGPVRPQPVRLVGRVRVAGGRRRAGPDRPGRRPAGRRRPRARHRRRPRHRRPGRAGHAAAYLELHIEQGPVLLGLGKPMGVVLGTFGVERHQITFTGQAAHSGSTPMGHRRDALGGVSKLHLAVRDIAVRHGGVGTVGSVKTRPGIVTAVVGEAEMTLDQRHLDAGSWPPCTPRRRPPAGDRRRGEGRRRLEAALVHPAVPVPPRPDRPGRAGRGRRVRASATACPAAPCTTRPRCAGPACRPSCCSCRACTASATTRSRTPARTTWS